MYKFVRGLRATCMCYVCRRHILYIVCTNYTQFATYGTDVLTSFFDEQKNEDSTTLLVAHVYTGST